MFLQAVLCCDRYEDEINKRAAAENEFVLLKKVQPLYIKIVHLIMKFSK